MNSVLRMIARVGIILVAAVVGLTALSAAVNAVLSAVERGGFQPPGRFVEVGGKKIHLVTTGSGPRVILLSGLGTPVPWLDFQALQQALSARTEVTTVEYPGYGLSDDTDAPRTTSASVDELRAALKAANLPPPYTLVVHSISGLQALDYASRFPNEVAGVVGLDSSLPGQLTYMPAPSDPDDTNAWLRNLGVLRWALALNPTLAGANTLDLSKDDQALYNRVVNWVLGSNAIAAEQRAVNDNLRSLDGAVFPVNVPVTFVLASESVAPEHPTIPGDAWQAMHEWQAAGHPRSRVVVLNGGHYIHHGHAADIAALVFEQLGVTP